MSVKAIVHVENPQETVVSITLSMPLKQWSDLLDQLPSGYPGWAVATAIRRAVDKISVRISADDSVDP